MWRLFVSSGLVKHEVPRFSTARPTYATRSAKSEIKEIGEKQCLRNWKERLHSLRAARAALVLQSPSVWLRTERTWPSHSRKVPMRPRRSSTRLNALAERRSQFRRTPLRYSGPSNVSCVQTRSDRADEECCARVCLQGYSH